MQTTSNSSSWASGMLFAEASQTAMNVCLSPQNNRHIYQDNIKFVEQCFMQHLKPTIMLNVTPSDSSNQDN
jgi:hypothetical protein